MEKNIYLYKSLGITLVLIGVPIGMYLNFFMNVTFGSSLTMFLSIVFLIYKEKIRFRIKKEFTLLFIFQIIMLIYWSISKSESASIQYLTFHLYILALIFSLSNINTVNFNQTIKCTFFISILLTIIGVIVCGKGLVTGDIAWNLRNENENYALEPFTISSGALIGYYSGLCINKKGIINKIIITIILLADIYIIWVCGKRTPLVLLILCTLIYFKKNTSLSHQNLLFSLIKIIIFAAILFIILIQNNDVQEELQRYSTHLYNGILNLLGDKNVSDLTGSAIARAQFRAMAIEYIQNQFEFGNYILGNGYMEKWNQIDNPILQAYLDMGIIGVIGYISFVIIVPLKRLLLYKVNTIQLFFIFCCLYNVFSSISSGNPYMYQKYHIICLLIFSFITKNKLEKIALNNNI